VVDNEISELKNKILQLENKISSLTTEPTSDSQFLYNQNLLKETITQRISTQSYNLFYETAEKYQLNKRRFLDIVIFYVLNDNDLRFKIIKKNRII
jgi:hypothetical protein